MFEQRPDWCIVCEVSDGVEAIRKSRELHPDLILLDVGLPRINGIEAARRIRVAAPNSRILFWSVLSCVDVAEEALRTGAQGYLLKYDAAHDLIPAIENVLADRRFVSDGLLHGNLEP
jgi:DNA-binding NarL/FixJ family response regulator